MTSLDPSLCPTCGRDHDGRCAGHLSSDKLDGRKAGDPCTRWPVAGADKCHMHGLARGTRGRAAADRNVVQARALGEVGKLKAELGQPADADEATVLLELIGAERLNVEILRMLHAELALTPYERDDEGRATGDRREALYGPDHLGDLRPHPIVAMLANAEDALAKHLKLATDMSLGDRLVRIEEAKADLVARALSAAFAELGIEPAVGLPAFGRHLRAIEARAEPA